MGTGKKVLAACGVILILGLAAATTTLAVLYANELNREEQTTPTTAAPTSTAPPITTTTPLPGYLASRINCFPEKQGDISQAWSISREQCESRGCTYGPETNGHAQVPPCYMHPRNIGYRVVESCMNCMSGKLLWAKLAPLSDATIFDPPIKTVTFSAYILNDNHLQFKIEDGDEKRFEVPFVPPTFKPSTTSNQETATFSIYYTANPFSFQVIRKKTGTVLFDSSMGGFVFSNRFLQITTRLPSNNFYGLGEHEHPTLRHNLQYNTWPMFSRDQPGLGPGYPLYGVHPMYMVVENDGNAHGLFLMNSNAMEYSLIPAPGVIMRTIGGIFDFHLYTGPGPENIVQQHTEFVGRPYLPPYWSLGFHLARWGYNNLRNVQAAINRTRQYGIPLDVIYADIDHMEKMKDFTLDQVNWADLPNYLKEEKAENGLSSVIILDPAITNNATMYDPWNVLNSNDSWVKWPDGNVMIGYVWPPGRTAFPDFFLNRTQEAWKDLIIRHSKVIPFDGLWIDMNEPSNFGTNEEKPWNWPAELPPWSLKCPKSDYDDPPYRTYAISRYDSENVPGRLSDKTLCMVAVQDDGKMKNYDIHSLYGWSQSRPTVEALQAAYPGRRGFVLSRSTFAGSSHYVSHWLGDNAATWNHLRRSIIGMLEMSLFGMPHTGPDICGFLDQTTPELCKRWMQLGAFYPYSRNHNVNGQPDQDPGALGPFVAEPSREYMRLRYTMLPYMYTLFYHAHMQGSTVARPLLHEWPTVKETLDVDTQFMLGPAFMVAPILDDSYSDLTAYMPPGTWLDVIGKGKLINLCGVPNGQKMTFAGVNDTRVFQRGGAVIAYQRLNDGNIVSTKFTRSQPLDVSVVFDCDKTATGSLFWDDGDSIDTISTGKYWLLAYTAGWVGENEAFLTAEVKHESSDAQLGKDVLYGSFTIYGLPKEPTVTITCQPGDYSPEYASKYDDGKLVVTVTSKQPTIGQGFKVAMKFDP